MPNPITRAHLVELRGIERAATAAAEWKVRVVQGDVRHYSVPGDRQHLNTNGAWAVTPLCRNNRQAAADGTCAVESRNALPALLDALESAWATIDAIEARCRKSNWIVCKELLAIIDQRKDGGV